MRLHGTYRKLYDLAIITTENTHTYGNEEKHSSEDETNEEILKLRRNKKTQMKKGEKKIQEVSN